MTTPHAQQRALRALKAATAQLDADDRASWYALAAACGQAARVLDAAEPALVAAQARLAGAPKHTLHAVNQDTLLGRLEAALDADDFAPSALLTALVELDDYGCAAQALGTPDLARPFLEEARLLVAIFEDAVASVAPVARVVITDHGLTASDLCFTLWETAANSEPVDLASATATPTAAISAWIAAQAGGVVLPFRRRPADQAPAQFARAAADGAALAQASVELERDGSRWTLAYEVPVGTPELALYTEPGDAIPFTVTVGGEALPIQADAMGRRAATLPDTDGAIVVQVGDRTIPVRYPDGL